MNILHVYTTYLELRRSLEILRILLKHGLREWFYKTAWGKRRLRRAPKARTEAKTTPERLRATIEDLGPTFVKFGQILADRPDVLSERFRKELKHLQSHVLPMDDKEAVHLIENELNGPLTAFFSEFDPHCLASASIGQVYQGRLLDGQPVVVKIQRPHIADQIKLDIYLLRFIARKFVKAYPDFAYMDVSGFVDEFSEQITLELDYYNEAENLARFGRMFAENPEVHIPAVYAQYTTKRLLVMEKVQGIAPDRLEDLRAAGMDLHQVAVNGANALLKMILEEGFFHADPHPGNIFIEQGNVVSFIDFGMTGVLRPKEMNFIADFCLSFTRKNPRAMCKALLTVCGMSHYADADELEFELDTLMKRYGAMPLEQINFAGLMQSSIHIMVKHRLKVPSDMFTLAKALLTLQKFAGDLDPDIALLPLVMPYAKKLVGYRFDPRKMATDAVDTVLDYRSLVKGLPGQIGEILDKLKEGKIRHEVEIRDLGPVNRNIRQVGYRIVTAVLLVGLFIGAIMMMTYLPDLSYGRWLFWISLILIFWSLFGSFFRKIRK